MPRRAALVGLVHWLAGSAALVLLALGAAESLAAGLVSVTLGAYAVAGNLPLGEWTALL